MMTDTEDIFRQLATELPDFMEGLVDDEGRQHQVQEPERQGLCLDEVMTLAQTSSRLEEEDSGSNSGSTISGFGGGQQEYLRGILNCDGEWCYHFPISLKKMVYTVTSDLAIPSRLRF